MKGMRKALGAAMGQARQGVGAAKQLMASRQGAMPAAPAPQVRGGASQLMSRGRGMLGSAAPAPMRGRGMMSGGPKFKVK